MQNETHTNGARARVLAIASGVIAASFIAGSAQASLIGDTMTADLLLNGSPAVSVTEVVLSGPEATGNWAGLFSYNLEASTSNIASLVTNPSQFWNSGLDFEFTDLDWVDSPSSVIVGATVTASGGAGFTSITDADLSWTDHSVFIDAQAISGIAANQDQFITITLSKAEIPTPGACALLGMAGLPLLRRRRA